MSKEYGIFNDEGLIEGGFYDYFYALNQMKERYDPDDEEDAY